ncbi:hypothetical protein AYI70_g2751 [Smittium culicis]|uniref:GDP/GTP exchange factor Sec2 N-terminal domain-containing protein n=1 Tax=Smittium culicis TaxID=133412 RepID=A0A1R1Y6Z5_9FUNG|nr:hypothetical protein AYI70_g2751 [Smittium culicis]
MYHNPYSKDGIKYDHVLNTFLNSDQSRFSNSIPILDSNKKLYAENIDARTFNVKINRNSSINISISRRSFIELTKTNSQIFKVLNNGAHFISKLGENSTDHTKEPENAVINNNIPNNENVHTISEIETKVVTSSIEMIKSSKLDLLEHSVDNHNKVLDPIDFKESESARSSPAKYLSITVDDILKNHGFFSDFNNETFAISSKFLIENGKNFSPTSNHSDSNPLINNNTLETSDKSQSISISFFSPDELIQPLKSIITPTTNLKLEKKSYGLKGLLSSISTKMPILKNEFKSEISGKRVIKKSNLEIKTNTIRSPQLAFLQNNQTRIHNLKDINTEIINPPLSNKSISKNSSSKKSVYSDEKNEFNSANDVLTDNNASSGSSDDLNPSSHILYDQHSSESTQKKDNKITIKTNEYSSNNNLYRINENPSYQLNHLDSSATKNTQISDEFDNLVKIDDLNLAKIDLESFSMLGLSSDQHPNTDNSYIENNPNNFPENSLSFFSAQNPLQTYITEKIPSSDINSPSSLSKNAFTKKIYSPKEHDRKYSDLSLNIPVNSTVENFDLNTIPNNTINENSYPRSSSKKNHTCINCSTSQENISGTLGSNKSLCESDHMDFSIVNINRPPSKSISYSPNSKKFLHSNIPDSKDDGGYGEAINSDIKKSVPRSKSHSNLKSEINSPNKSHKLTSPKKTIDDSSNKKKNITNSNILNKLTNMFSLDKSEELAKADSDVMDNLSPMEYKKKILYLQKTIDRQNKRINKLENLVIDKQEELDMATEEILNLKNENDKVLKEKAEIEDEIEELSKSLFTEANNLVKNEAILRHNAEQKVIALEKEIAILKGADAPIKSPPDLGIISPIMDK